MLRFLLVVGVRREGPGLKPAPGSRGAFESLDYWVSEVGRTFWTGSGGRFGPARTALGGRFGPLWTHGGGGRFCPFCGLGA